MLKSTYGTGCLVLAHMGRGRLPILLVSISYRPLPAWGRRTGIRTRAARLGLSRGTGGAEIVRACLEAMAYQTHDLGTAMIADGATIERLRIDGGMARNDWLAQDLAEVLDRPIERPRATETTALGAALLAGLGAGLYPSLDAVSDVWQAERSFMPQMSDAARTERLAGWHQAIARIRS